MARKKVTLVWIANDAARRATFKKRRKGLLKKVSELTTLCAVKACVVVYGAGEQQPEVWPSAPEAMRLVSRFRALPEMEQNKKMMNQEGFVRHNIAKLQEQLRKMESDGRELVSNHLMYECLAGNHPGGLRSIAELVDAGTLAWVLDMKLKSVQEKMASMSSSANPGASSGSQAATFDAAVAPGSSQLAANFNPADVAAVTQGGNFKAAVVAGSQTSVDASSALQVVGFNAARASELQRAATFRAAVQIPLHNPFPLLLPPPAAPVGTGSVGNAPSAPSAQNLLALARTPMEVAAAEAALNARRRSYFIDYGVGGNSMHGSLSSIVQNHQGAMNMMMMMPGSSSGTAGQQQDETLPPGFEDPQALSITSWFDGNWGLNANYRSDYNP